MAELTGDLLGLGSPVQANGHWGAQERATEIMES